MGDRSIPNIRDLVDSEDAKVKIDAFLAEWRALGEAKGELETPRQRAFARGVELLTVAMIGASVEVSEVLDEAGGEDEDAFPLLAKALGTAMCSLVMTFAKSDAAAIRETNAYLLNEVRDNACAVLDKRIHEAGIADEEPAVEGADALPETELQVIPKECVKALRVITSAAVRLAKAGGEDGVEPERLAYTAGVQAMTAVFGHTGFVSAAQLIACLGMMCSYFGAQLPPERRADFFAMLAEDGEAAASKLAVSYAKHDVAGRA